MNHYHLIFFVNVNFVYLKDLADNGVNFDDHLFDSTKFYKCKNFLQKFFPLEAVFH